MARQIANNHMEQNSQAKEADNNIKVIMYECKVGNQVLLRIFDLKNKNRKLAKSLNSLSTILKILGQVTAKRERAKIVNFLTLNCATLQNQQSSNHQI
jgi:hypothetical protein